MAQFSINFDVAHFDPTSENVQRVKDLLLHALTDMVINNGHLIDESRDFALAQLVIDSVAVAGDTPDDQLESAFDAARRELAKEAEVL